MREHGDQLLGDESPTLLEGIALDLFDELRPMRDGANPADDCLRESHVFGCERVGSLRCDLHHSAALAANIERNADLRANLQYLSHA
jgi:hypothetical protein